MKKVKKRQLLAVSIFLPLLMFADGCANIFDTEAQSSELTGSAPGSRGDMGTLVYRAVDLILAGAPEMTPATPIIVASISDTENLRASSPLGNIVSDLIRTRLVQDGHHASEVRLRKTLSFSKGAGEFLLSRDPGVILPARAASAVVTGTYAASNDRVYFSLKLLSAAEGTIISGADFVVPIREVKGLL